MRKKPNQYFPTNNKQINLTICIENINHRRPIIHQSFILFYSKKIELFQRINDIAHTKFMKNIFKHSDNLQQEH